MAGGSIISRLYNFVNGMIVQDYHLDDEFDRIHQWLNGMLGNANLASDANIEGSKLKDNSIPSIKIIGGTYTKAELDLMFTNANLVGIADRMVAGIKLSLGAVGTLELADEGITASKIDADDLPAIKTKLGINKTWRQGHTWAISGDVKVPIGDSDFLNPFFISLAPGQQAKISKVIHRINSGTSAQIKLQKNGVDVPGYTAITLTTTTTTLDVADVDLADGDKIALVVTSITGTPKNMSFTLFIDHSV